MNASVVTKHELLERKANIMRGRLLRTLDVLDRRRHHVTDVAEDMAAIARRAAVPLGVALGSLLAVGISVAVVLNRRAERARRRHLGTWVARALRPPPPDRPRFLLEALRKAGVAVLVAVATEIAKRQAKQLAGIADRASARSAEPSRP